MKKNKIHFWFTLVEIIVVISILVILTTISFISYRQYLTQSRDTNRVTSLSTISKWLKYYFLKNSKYPNPDNSLWIGTINNIELSKTGYIWEKITKELSIKNKPVDPFTWNEFSYWVNYNNKNYQLAATTEWLLSSQFLMPTTYAQGWNKAYVVWNYDWLIKRNGILYNLPSLIFSWSVTGGKVDLASTGTYFIVNNSYNTPYSLTKNEESYLQPTSEILLNVLWASTGAISSFDIKNLDWETSSWVLAETLGYNTDKLWLYLYGEDFTPTLWVPSVKWTWSTTPISTTFACQDMTQENVDNLNIFFDSIWELMTEWVTFEDQKNDYCNLSQLHLWRYDITDLPIEIGYLTNLSILDIQGNSLTELPDTIWNLINLVEFNISDTAIWVLPNSIGNLSWLTSFYAYGSQLSTLPASISWWSSITEINLWGIWLTSIPTELFSLSTLNSLYLDENSLSSFALQPWQLPNLANLGLSRNMFEDMPANIANLPNLSYFTFAGNTIVNFPDISSLTFLTELDLSECGLASFPLQLLSLTQLNNLYLRWNQITEVPSSIWNLVNLLSLDLWENQITSLPIEIWNLVNLNYLRLWYNQLSDLPSEMSNLENLIEIDISSNLFTAIPDSITSLVNLSYLWASYNQLTSLPENIGNLTNLYSINVVWNNLSTLPVSFWNLSGITWLDLSENNFAEFPVWIANMTSINYVYLNNNNMTTIPATITNLNNKLSWLDLSNNPWIWTLNRSFSYWNTTTYSNAFSWIGTVSIRWSGTTPYKLIFTHTP